MTEVMLIKENIKLGLALLTVSEVSPLLSLQKALWQAGMVQEK